MGCPLIFCYRVVMVVPANLPQAPRRSLVDSAIDLIRAQIESGAWKIGDRIPKENELATMLQVGRNTVREAIRVLSHAHVLDVRQGDGTYVRASVDPAEIMRRVSRSSLRDHFELRAMLETQAAALAAEKRTEDELKRLRHLLRERGERSDHPDLAAFLARDIAFHSAIADASHNVALAELYRYFASTVRANMETVLVGLHLPEPGLAAHRAILKAIERRDAAAAAAAARTVSTALIVALSDQPEA